MLNNKYRLLTKKEIQVVEKIGIRNLSTDQLKQYLFSKGFYDTKFFAETFLSPWHINPSTKKETKTPKHIEEIRVDLEKWINQGKDLNLILPRWHGKTTSVTEFIIKILVYGIVDSILYIAPASLWEEQIWKIKKELETNQLLISVFWDLVPKKEKESKEKYWTLKWKAKLLQLTNGVSIETLPIGWRPRGKRPKFVVIDDPQDNKDVRNKRVVDKFNEFILSSLYNTMLPGGSMVVIGTIVWEMCLVNKLQKDWWNTIKKPAILDENKKQVLWPELWSYNKLAERRKKVGTPIFNQEFQHIPITSGSSIIENEWLKYWHNLPEMEEIYLAIDPATSEKELADFTWVSVVWKSGEKIYSLFSTGVKKSPGKLYNYILMLNKKYKPNAIIYEENKEVKLLEDLRLAGLPMFGVWAHKDKGTRLLQITWIIEFGNVLFNPNDDDLTHQLTHFPDVEHDDVMDAFVYNLLYIQQWNNLKISSL